jgi:hypothetical protein
MNLDKELFIEALENIEFDYKSSTFKVTDKSLEFFEEIGLSTELIEFLKDFSFRHELDFEGIYFNCVNKIRTENLEEVNKEIYKQDLLIIGSGMNGDPIVLNTKTMKVGFVFHDKLWENETIENLQEMYIDMNMSIGQFFYKSTTEEDFPIDAYDAEEYTQ